MDRDVFAKNVIAADAESGRVVLVFEVLWGFADHAAGVKAVHRSDFGVAGKVNVWANHAVCSEADVRIDDDIRADFASGIELGGRVDDRGRVNHESIKMRRGRIGGSKNSLSLGPRCGFPE